MLWLWVALPTLFVAFWWGTCHLMAETGGWAQAARRYSATTATEATAFRWWQWVRVGTTTYSPLKVEATPTHFCLSPMPLFKPGHPGLRIPWVDIQAQAATECGRRIATLRLSKVPTVPIQIPWSLALDLVTASGGAFRGLNTSE